MKRFLILQLRPEDEAADGELEAFLHAGGLEEDQIRRVRIERDGVPEVDLDDYAAVIVGGGPSNVSDKQKDAAQQRFEVGLHDLLGQVVARDFPYFGACYGLGVMAQIVGGEVSKERYGEPVAAITVELTEAAQEDPLMAGLPREFRAFVGHKEACQGVPPGAVLLASSATCPVQMIRLGRNIYASQFHPELDGPGIAVRIRVYKDAGYFPPEDADKLIESALSEQVTIPETIFRRFVERYGQ